MAGIRQLPQAKYELLLENRRSTYNLGRITAAAGLLVIIIGATALAVGLPRMGLKDIKDNTYTLDLLGYSRNRSIFMESLKHKTELYGLALQEGKSSYKPGYEIILQPPSISKTQRTDDGNELYKLVCYYVLPDDMNTTTQLMPEELDPSLCTHIIIAFARIVNATLQPSKPGDLQLYKRVVALKTDNSSLKVMLCVGGDSSPGGFSDMVATHKLRKAFIRHLLSLISEYSMDGVDFDWEFPGWNSNSRERIHFTQLLEELREEINRRHLILLISVAVAAPKPIIDSSYDVPEMAMYVDFINVMTYDYHFFLWYLPVTGSNAPLYNRVDETGYFSTLNTNWTINYWISKGMPKEKIIIGMPTYGHSFTLMNEDNHGFNAPASGIGALGDGSGFTSYPNVCWFLNQAEAASVFDRDSRVPYAFTAKEWVSYDDERSLAYKAEYVVSNGYGGGMIFSLNMDDYRGECTVDNTTFLLSRRVRLVLSDDQLRQMERSLSEALGI